MAVKETTHNLYDTVRKDYHKLSQPDSKYGVQKFTDKYIFKALAERYFKSEKTIENIVFNRV